MAASEGSDATMDCSRTEFESQSRRCGPSDRKITSRASCVKPRWDREPRIVCVYASRIPVSVMVQAAYAASDSIIDRPCRIL